MIDFDNCNLVSLNDDILQEFYSWEYDNPYDIYNLSKNDYFKDKSTWGIEQFALVNKNKVIAQVACQILDNDMWVGWSLKPELCGNGNSNLFIKKCINELIHIKRYTNQYIFLKVEDWNKRAINAYKKAEFKYYGSIKRNVDKSNDMVNFHIMRKEIKS